MQRTLYRACICARAHAFLASSTPIESTPPISMFTHRKRPVWWKMRVYGWAPMGACPGHYGIYCYYSITDTNKFDTACTYQAVQLFTHNKFYVHCHAHPSSGPGKFWNLEFVRLLLVASKTTMHKAWKYCIHQVIICMVTCVTPFLSWVHVWNGYAFSL